MNRLDLDGRVAVVTGGASGIGLAIARRIAHSGGRVCLWDVDDEALTLGRADIAGAYAVLADVRDAVSVEVARDETISALGRIDVLVNSAGVTGPNALTWEYPLDGWRTVLDVNLTGTFHTCRAIVPTMLAAGYGRIVNIASVAGKEGNPNASAYSASKAGVIALTKSLGKELAMTAIRVNCVTPAAVETKLFAQMTPAHIEYMRSKIPMGRFGMPDEIAALVVWLCTEECSFSTGATFDLSGGRTTY